MKDKLFDCVEMKRKGAEVAYQIKAFCKLGYKGKERLRGKSLVVNR